MNIEQMLDSATATKAEFTLIPEGQYKGQLTDVRIEDSDEATKLNVEITLTHGEYLGRKVYWSSKLNKTKTAEQLAGQLNFVKSQICQMAGTESTDGKPFEVLANARGNYVDFTLKHKPGYKDPSKLYHEVLVNGVTDPF